MNTVITMATVIIVVANRTLLPIQCRARTQDSTRGAPVPCLLAKLDFMRIWRITADGEGPVDTLVSLVVEDPPAHVRIDGKRVCRGREREREYWFDAMWRCFSCVLLTVIVNGMREDDVGDGWKVLGVGRVHFGTYYLVPLGSYSPSRLSGV